MSILFGGAKCVLNLCSRIVRGAEAGYDEESRYTADELQKLNEEFGHLDIGFEFAGMYFVYIRNIIDVSCRSSHVVA